MSLFATLKSALGLQRPIQPAAAGPVTLSAEAARHVVGLPPGTGLEVSTYAMGEGRVARFATITELPPEHTGGAALVMTATDRDHLRGLQINYDGNAFHLTASLEVSSEETPNPDSRRYLTSRNWATGKPQFFTGEGPKPRLAARLLEVEGVASVLIRDNTVTVERVPESSWRAIDAGVEAALRTHLLRMGKPLPAPVPTDRDGLAAAVAELLEERVAPAIRRDGGDIELVDITDGIVRVRLTGACRTCPASSMTLKMGVESALREAFPEEIDGVVQL